MRVLFEWFPTFSNAKIKEPKTDHKQLRRVTLVKYPQNNFHFISILKILKKRVKAMVDKNSKKSNSKICNQEVIFTISIVNVHSRALYIYSFTCS